MSIAQERKEKEKKRNGCYAQERKGKKNKKRRNGRNAQEKKEKKKVTDTFASVYLR